MTETDRAKLLALTSDIVSAHAANNHVPTSDMPQMIEAVFDQLAKLDNQAQKPPELVPAVPINKSVTDEYIICLEDGKHLKMLKRYLRNTYDLTPEQYRIKWGLPHHYPMVAPAYTRKRQALARKIGLGQRPAAGKKRRRKG